jgi:hypothetical protein
MVFVSIRERAQKKRAARECTAAFRESRNQRPRSQLQVQSTKEKRAAREDNAAFRESRRERAQKKRAANRNVKPDAECQTQDCSYVGQQLFRGYCTECRAQKKRAAAAAQPCSSQDCSFMGKLYHGFCAQCREAAWA